MHVSTRTNALNKKGLILIYRDVTSKLFSFNKLLAFVCTQEINDCLKLQFNIFREISRKGGREHYKN